LFLNGRNIFPSDGPALLSSKSRIQIGSIPFLFLLPSVASSSSKTSQTGSVHPTSEIIDGAFVEGITMDEDKYQAVVPTSSQVITQQNVKKRKHYDRSIIPLARLPSIDEPTDRKRKYFGEHISKRSNSMRSIIFGDTYGEEDLRPYLGGPSLAERELAAPYLSAHFSPRLDTGYGLSMNQSHLHAEGKASSSDSMASEVIGSPKAATGGIRLPKVAESGDASGTVFERPKMTYGQLIRAALDSSADKRMLFSEITDWVVRTFPYFGTPAAANWHNSLRHSLSNITDFVRQERAKATGKGKGGFWALAQWYEGDRLLSKPKY
jgi:hypothetical protein